MMMGFSKIFVPPRYRFLKKGFPEGKFQLLDVGCGHLSFETVRHFFPGATYHGVDKRLQGELGQYEKMDKFFNVDLETDSFESIPDAAYDAVIFSHTIEHIFRGHEVLKKLIRKLKNGGYIYLEFPSIRSLFLPSADGTLNFFDDPTHVRFYDMKELVNTLLEADVRILRLGKARNPWKATVVTPVAILHNAYYLLRHGKLSAKGMLEVTGFADYILGVKHSIPHDVRRGSWRETAEVIDSSPSTTAGT